VVCGGKVVVANIVVVVVRGWGRFWRCGIGPAVASPLLLCRRGAACWGQHLAEFLQPMQQSEVQGGGRGGIDSKALVALQSYGGGDTLTSETYGQQITSGYAT
jgi:hypothetical protein